MILQINNFFSNSNWNNTNLQNFITRTPSSTQAKAYLNWVLFDEQLKYVSGDAAPVKDGGGYLLLDKFINAPVNVTKNGFLYVFVSNESNLPVYFDNLTLTHTNGPILEETHYYPFGLIQQGISSKAAGTLHNRKKFNGIEQTTELDINQYDAFYRNADPQIGRWWQIDPKPNIAQSPYSMMGNNPLLYSDFLGDTLRIRHKKSDYIYENGKLFNSNGTAYTGKVKGFLKQTVKALDKGRTTTEGAKGIGQLQESKNNFTVVNSENSRFVPDNRNNAQATQVINQLGIPVDASKPFDQIGSGGTIEWNPTSATVNGTTFSPEQILYHEIGHAIDADKGLMDRTLMKVHGVCCEERTEVRAIYFQNVISQQLGPNYPLRRYYGGTENPPMPPTLIKNGQPVYVPPPAVTVFPLRLTPTY